MVVALSERVLSLIGCRHVCGLLVPSHRAAASFFSPVWPRFRASIAGLCLASWSSLTANASMAFLITRDLKGQRHAANAETNRLWPDESFTGALADELVPRTAFYGYRMGSRRHPLHFSRRGAACGRTWSLMVACCVRSRRRPGSVIRPRGCSKR
jgi:hypothetical protein